MNKGQIVSATVTGFVIRDDIRHAALVTVDGEPGILHRRDVVGSTRDERQETLGQMSEGQALEVELTGTANVNGERGLRVSQFGAVRRRWQEQVEGWVNQSTVFKAEVIRVEASKGYVILDLPEGVQALLHFSNCVGDTDEQKLARLAQLQVGDAVHVTVVSAKRPGRLRVRELV